MFLCCQMLYFTVLAAVYISGILSHILPALVIFWGQNIGVIIMLMLFLKFVKALTDYRWSNKTLVKLACSIPVFFTAEQLFVVQLN